MHIYCYRYELFSNRDETGYISLTLPAKEFPDFANEDSVTWPSFRKKFMILVILLRFCYSSNVFTTETCIFCKTLIEVEICDVKEIKKYNVAVGIIATYQQNTLRGQLCFRLLLLLLLASTHTDNFGFYLFACET